MCSTHSRFTLEDVAQFCWENKKRRGFKGFSFEEVCKVIIIAAQKDMLKLVQDEHGICGVAVLRANDNKVFVDFLIAVRGGFKTFVDYYKKNFSGFLLQGERDGKVVTFNTRILCQHLQKT